jgi:hypothetical protein
MYVTPELTHLGSLSELTLGGGATLIDPFGPNGNGAGCEGPRKGPITCRTPDLVS